MDPGDKRSQGSFFTQCVVEEEIYGDRCLLKNFKRISICGG
ncbi:hypothetical protein GCWU000342_00225 [Shuttleworthella satelles DSM 14600]|uniref:Uncharacterized protein n=1 Tax=Shuttleworthella satelles DSM 14600 TaxID=626523 RepID=C4G8C9_9FIRM|nr:hypothetical protein GCWU000342_00225 [Shuttleworthia satelles DSM 14600]